MLDICAKLLDVAETSLSHFKEIDPFNSQEVEGYLCRASDHRYGALVIVAVNGQPLDEPEIVYCTPKLHYPFGRTDLDERRYHFPEKVVHVEVYNKLDGTNICCFSYPNHRGERFVSFKTRLTPFLRKGKWGDFLSMWWEILVRFPTLRAPECVLSGEYSLSYELYGYRNPHMIVYPTALDTRLLFGVRQAEGTVEPPHRFTDIERGLRLFADHSFDNPEDLIGFYNEMREKANENNKLVDDDRIEGTEGYIFYILDESNRWSQWKAKPESIEALHWAGDNLPMSVILPTVWNALESVEGELTPEYIQELLSEEFSKTQTTNSYNRIERAVNQVKIRLAWRERVKIQYRGIGMTIADDGKSEVMRAMAGFFDKTEMRDVYNALRELGEVE
jgi:hypothetical protein